METDPIYRLFIIWKIKRLKPFNKEHFTSEICMVVMKENYLSGYYVSIFFVVYGVMAQVVFGWQRTLGQSWPIRKTRATGSLDSSRLSGLWNILHHSWHMSSWFGMKKNLDYIRRLLQRESETQWETGKFSKGWFDTFAEQTPRCILANLLG